MSGIRRNEKRRIALDETYNYLNNLYLCDSAFYQEEPREPVSFQVLFIECILPETNYLKVNFSMIDARTF